MTCAHVVVADRCQKCGDMPSGRDYNAEPESITSGPNYHRNGVSGTGFNVFGFTYEGKDLIAVVFPGQGNIAVINPADLQEGWRGDTFETFFRQALSD